MTRPPHITNAAVITNPPTGAAAENTGRSGGQYITDFHPQRTPLVRMNGVCPYFSMFPLPFPYRRLRKETRRTRVLDPFCGRGTTNFAARLLEIESVGLDSNPVAAAFAQSKLVSVSAADVWQACHAPLAEGDAGIPPHGDFWSLCYDRTTLREICTVRNHLLAARRLTKAQVALRAIMLGILHGPVMKGAPTYLSNQMPRTYSTKPGSAIGFWRKHRMRPAYVDVLDAVKRRAEYLLKEVPLRTDGLVRLADSRKQKSYEGLGTFDLVLTSPPYLGMRTYWPDQRLRNWFLGGLRRDEKPPLGGLVGHQLPVLVENHLRAVPGLQRDLPRALHVGQPVTAKRMPQRVMPPSVGTFVGIGRSRRTFVTPGHTHPRIRNLPRKFRHSMHLGATASYRPKTSKIFRISFNS